MENRGKIVVAGIFALCVGAFFSCRSDHNAIEVRMRGVVLSVEDLNAVDWPALAAECGINTIGTHIFPDQVLNFIRSEKGRAFLRECKELHIDVEHQLHAMNQLLPRELFAEDSTMFRMDSVGRRTPDFNCCATSEKALEIIASKALFYARELTPTNHRYYFWMDDGKPMCECPSCKNYSPSEQALLIENEIIKVLRTFDPKARLAHLAYQNTLEAPQKVKPVEGVFWEFAPINRSWQKPLADTTAEGRGMTHAANLKFLRDNLKVFSPETAVVLEYWLDVSLFSNWKKPAVELPWNRAVCELDMETYAQFGLEDITTFAVYMDSMYFSQYQDKSCLKEYGRIGC